MLTEMVEYGHKIEEKGKAIQSKLRKNIQGANNEGKETGIQINDLEQKEEINIQPEHNEETRTQKMRRAWDNFKHPNIWVIPVMAASCKALPLGTS